MIIYNREQQFLGLSEEYIHKFGYSSLSEIKHKINSDFSDLFLNRRGFMSNFQYISWIDYILENGENAKALVRGGGNKLFETTFFVKPFYFLNSKEHGFSVYIKDIKEIIESNLDSDEVIEQKQNSDFFETDNYRPSVPKMDFDDFDEKIMESDELNNLNFQTLDEFEILSQDEIDSIINQDDEKDDNKFKDTKEEDKKVSVTLQADNYDVEIMAKEFDVAPSVLADFVRDFVNQVKNMKSYLYSLITDGNIDEIQGVIQRIKGSAVNLRIEDTSNLLLKIYNNNYSSIGELKEDIDSLYYMIDKLEDSVSIEGEVLSIEDIAQIDSSANVTIQVKEYLIDKINRTGLPNNMFENMVVDFINIFQKSKYEIENNLNIDGFNNIKAILLEIKKMSDSLNIEDLKAITDEMYENIQSGQIEFDKLVISWIELSSYLDNLIITNK